MSLSKQLGLSIRETHIGMFDVAECKKVITVSNDLKEGLRPC